MSDTFSYLLMAWLDPGLLGLTALGVIAGIYIGAIPGLSVTMAVSILISFTFSWEINNALALMVGIYVGGVYGGSRTAILLNIPGAPSAVTTAFDGYPLAQKGEAGKAIGLSTVMSVIGGLIGVVVLAATAPHLADLALKFAPRDYFLIAAMGLLLVSSLSGKSLARGIFSVALGATIGLVGMDMVTAQPRLTMGSMELLGGIHYVVVMIGLFGVAEAFYQLHNMAKVPVKQNVDKIVPPLNMVLKFLPLSLRTSIIGVVVGALPGTGGDIASLFAYDHAKRTVKNPEVPFGEGAYEGLVAPETANNAAVGGAYVPMLTLGMPGDAVTAVIIGALVIHGLNPGPMLMIETPYIFWFTVGNLALANIFLLIFGLTGIKLFSKIVEVPKAIMIPLILVLCVVGTYSLNSSMTEVYWMLGFGILGYWLKMFGFQMGPIILGVILGPLLDQSYRQAMSSVGDSSVDFLLALVINPLSLVLTSVIVLVLLGNTPLKGWLYSRFKRS
ncbi:tripartite tricarboxylate transporter permease [Halomonas sp. ISL-60]|uniref:tripartite tricarboxylate transporter permease n=1 Tax=unclassified Halomonas TaxID=2609666 RepID=UPI0007DA470E|nr:MULTISPECIES: tripartite tricarboxylate transporter permease [unclassified Halomonas]MBT2772283.1 tripartite tricarboxylate transporter permease [Halomonas sp. ISL-60]MBT2789061.1 tripartite tricarboxylate transporter permease [Halomonas sp. ISL-106]MBT2799679.1 tripartite tricarboxylate transporter permease [Halomonas sp. ISL-104]MBT2800720.1 tripartite tricarboxylate transporter permease [Halomonas sp. ISL-56]OAL60186.1 C4-dicarboxylate ABC transporter permease [Halomonas sp. ALS9]